MNALSRAIADPPSVVGVTNASAMVGLERRRLGFIDVLAQPIGAMAPAAVAATFPAFIVAQSGGAALIALVVAWAVLALVASTIGQFTRRMVAPGSLYTFVTKGLGPTAGFATSVALVIGYGLVAMGSLTGASAYARTAIGALGQLDLSGPVWAVAGVVVFGVLAYVVLRSGIRLSARVTLVIELASIAVVLALVVIVLTRLDPASLLAPFSAPLPQPGQLVTGTAIAITAFVGFESAASLGVETARPFARIPRVMRWTVLGAGVLYLVSTYTEIAGFAAIGVPLDDSSSPVDVLASAAQVSWIGTVLDLGLAASFAACAIASLTALSRVLFSLGREGVIPRVLGTTDRSRRTPRAALHVVVPITVLAPAALLLAGWTTQDALRVLVAASASGYIVAYVLVCIAAPVFLRRLHESTVRATVVAVAAAVVLAIVFFVYLGVLSAGPLAAATWIVAGCAVAGLVAYLVVRGHRRRPLGRMGLFDQTTAADILGAGGEAEPKS